MLSWCCNRERDGKKQSGVGIVFETSPEGALIVQGLVPGSPAENCGLIAAGDTLYEINGKSFYRAGTDEVAAFLLGAEGTTVRVGLKRGLRYESDPLFQVTLVRRPVSGAGCVETIPGRPRR